MDNRYGDLGHLDIYNGLIDIDNISISHNGIIPPLKELTI